MAYVAPDGRSHASRITTRIAMLADGNGGRGAELAYAVPRPFCKGEVFWRGARDFPSVTKTVRSRGLFRNPETAG